MKLIYNKVFVIIKIRRVKVFTILNNTYTFNNQKLFHILHKHFKDIRTYHTSTLYHLRSLYSILYYFYTFLCL